MVFALRPPGNFRRPGQASPDTDRTSHQNRRPRASAARPGTQGFRTPWGGIPWMPAFAGMTGVVGSTTGRVPETEKKGSGTVFSIPPTTPLSPDPTAPPTRTVVPGKRSATGDLVVQARPDAGCTSHKNRHPGQAQRDLTAPPIRTVIPGKRSATRDPGVQDTVGSYFLDAGFRRPDGGL